LFLALPGQEPALEDADLSSPGVELTSQHQPSRSGEVRKRRRICQAYLLDQMPARRPP
jgi:hypothetical protein